MARYLILSSALLLRACAEKLTSIGATRSVGRERLHLRRVACLRMLLAPTQVPGRASVPPPLP